MSAKYEVVMKFYASGAWDDKRVRDAVDKGWITAEEYEQITGKKY